MGDFMTNKELYDIAKECRDTGNTQRFNNILPNHYLAKGEKFVLLEGNSKYGAMFNSINNVAELDAWASSNYKLSGRYSDELTIALLPKLLNIRLEIKNRFIYKALWMITPGMNVDITHNIHFIGGVPICRMPSDNGYILGSIVSKLSNQELYKLMISPFPDEQILACDFVVSCAHFMPIVFDEIGDMFETLNRIGFKTAVLLGTTTPKWSRAIESAKLVAGSGNLGYACTKVLTSYSDIEMVDLLSTTTINKWGVTTDISPTTLFEVVGLSWDTVVDNGQVNIMPVVAFKYGNYPLEGVAPGQIKIDTKARVFYKKIFGFNVRDIDKYCIGDVFSCVIKDGQILLERKFGSGKIPILAPGCPKCGYRVDVRDNKMFCINPRCPAVILGSVQTWVDKFCPQVGQHIMVDFMRRYEISNIGDIYMVADSGDMSIVEYLPIFEGVEKSRQAPGEFLNVLMPFLDFPICDRIMASFSVSSMGVEHTIDQIFLPSTLARLELDGDIIDKTLEFLDTNKVQFVNFMRRYREPPSKHKLYKRTFFIDGLLYDRDRFKYEKVISNYCGRVISNFMPYVTGVIYGKYIDSVTMGAIKQLATHKDVAIYSEEEFNKLVNQADGGK